MADSSSVAVLEFDNLIWTSIQIVIKGMVFLVSINKYGMRCLGRECVSTTVGKQVRLFLASFFFNFIFNSCAFLS